MRIMPCTCFQHCSACVRRVHLLQRGMDSPHKETPNVALRCLLLSWQANIRVVIWDAMTPRKIILIWIHFTVNEQDFAGWFDFGQAVAHCLHRNDAQIVLSSIDVISIRDHLVTKHKVLECLKCQALFKTCSKSVHWQKLWFYVIYFSYVWSWPVKQAIISHFFIISTQPRNLLSLH